MYLSEVCSTTSAGNSGGWTVAIPLAGEQPLANELFIKRRLTLARGIQVRRPEPRTVWREDFVDQNQTSIEPAPFEFGVSDDQAAGGSILGRLSIDLQAEIAQFVCRFQSDALRHEFKTDVLIVARFSLGRWRENRLGQSVTLSQSSWQLHAADLAGSLILAPPRAFEITTHDAFERNHIRFPDDHTSSFQHRLGGFSDLRMHRNLHRKQMMLNWQTLEPKLAQLRQHTPFVRNPAREYPVESTDAVGADDQKSIAEVIDIANFPLTFWQI